MPSSLRLSVPSPLCLYVFTDSTDEAIAAPVRRLDESRRFRIVAKRFAYLAYADLQHRICHCGVGPAGVEKLLFRHQLPRPIQKVGEHGESLRAQWQGFVAAPQPLVGRVQAERGEENLSLLRHGYTPQAIVNQKS